VLGNHPSRRFSAIAESNHPGRSGDAGNAGTVARPDRISSPATRCSSRRFLGTYGLPINKNNNNPIPGRKKINNNHAIADDGRRRSGTNPNATTLITNNPTYTNTVAIISGTLQPESS
jgi:hypothetical protein